MNQRIFDIFDNMNDKIPNQKAADEQIEREVYAELEKLRDSEVDAEELKDMCFSVAHTAKRQWFAVGFHYAMDFICKRK